MKPWLLGRFSTFVTESTGGVTAYVFVVGVMLMETPGLTEVICCVSDTAFAVTVGNVVYVLVTSTVIETPGLTPEITCVSLRELPAIVTV